MGPLSVAALVAGNMVGAGVFTTSGFSLAELGDPRWVLAAWLCGGVVALCGALAYGGLATRIPRSGGEYTFLSEALHPGIGFMAGWVSFLAGFTAPIALAALVLETYLGSAFDGPPAVGGALILLFGLLHGLRFRAGVRVQNAAVFLKIAGALGFVAWAVLRSSAVSATPAPAAESGASVAGFAVTLVWISFAYSGWNGAVYLAAEIRDPERNVRRAMWMTTVVVAFLYLLLNAVFVTLAPIDAVSGRPDVASAAAAALGGPTAARGVAVLVALALATSISAMLMSGPRVYAQMARDGLMPQWLAGGADTPAVAVALQTGVALLVYVWSDLVSLLGYLGFTLGLSAALTVFSAARLRRLEGPARVPIAGYPWTPAIFILFTLGAAGFLVAREPYQALYGGLTALIGWPLYLFMRARNH